MSTSDSPTRTPMKSKRQLLSTPKPKADSLLSSKTPDKPPESSRLTRNRRVALSLKQIRKEAVSIRESNREEPSIRTDVVRSTRKQILRDESPASRSKTVTVESTKLPEKYEMLADFYDGLDSSIRLLRLKGSTMSFTNLCTKIEYLTDRRFSDAHLAQLKFILPEVIETKKVLVFDERTSCMKPDLQVNLNVDAIANDSKLKAENSIIHLRKVFRARLMDFFKEHPEVDEIPEEPLPEPFGSKKKFQPNVGRTLNASSATETETEGYSQQQLRSACHVSHSFRRHFSQNIPKLASQSAHPQHPSLHTEALIPSRHTEALIPVQSIKGISSNNDSMVVSDSAACLALSCLPETPSKPIDPLETSKVQVTPSKHVLSPATVGTDTPQLHPPKRSLLTPNNDLEGSPNKLARRPPRTRSLKFDTPQKSGSRRLPRTRSLKFDTPQKNGSIQNDANNLAGSSLDAVELSPSTRLLKIDSLKKDEADEMEGPSIADDVYDILPDSLLQSIKEKELKAMEERDPAISQAKRRKQMIASLPKVFNMIHFLFQSTTRSTITKEELVHKIIGGHLDIVDRREVEEQLELLLELVPEWIYEKLASSGDTLIRINKMSSAELVRARIEEAT